MILSSKILRRSNMTQKKTLAILVGGGPAPGINAVISSATIEAINEGFDILGIQDGFKRLIREDTRQARRLRIEDVSRIHLNGGSVLGTAHDYLVRIGEKDFLDDAWVEKLTESGGVSKADLIERFSKSEH